MILFPARSRVGFTLIELIIVIAILGILAAAVFVVINPGKRAKQARDAQRKTDLIILAKTLESYLDVTLSYEYPDPGADLQSDSTEGDNWIPGLDLPSLPKDPKQTSLISLLTAIIIKPVIAANTNVTNSAELANALNNAQPGDTITLANSTYPNTSAFNIDSKNGIASNLITIKAANPGMAIITGTSNNTGFNITNSSYIVIDGLVFDGVGTGEGGAGISASSSNNLSIRNSRFSNNFGSGIKLNAVINSLVDSNTFIANNRHFGGGIRMDNGSNSNTISNNTIDGGGTSGGSGIFVCGDFSCNSTGNNLNIFSRNIIHNVLDSCMYFDTNNDGNIIERNSCYDSYRNPSNLGQGGNGIHVALGGDNNIIRNNLVYNTQRHGISLRDGNAAQGYVSNNNNVIYSNTVYNAGTTSGSGISIQGTNPNTIIKNNILFQAAAAPLTIDAGSTPTIDSDYNLFYDSGTIVKYGDTSYSILSAYQSASSQDTQSIEADPKFVNATSDFGLQSTSPAINVGVTLSGFSNDFPGNLRPIGSAWDIGAYEGTGALPPTPTPTPTQIPTPTLDFKYLYIVSDDLLSFTLWATLENEDDPDINNCPDPPEGFNYCVKSL